MLWGGSEEAGGPETEGERRGMGGGGQNKDSIPTDTGNWARQGLFGPKYTTIGRS